METIIRSPAMLPETRQLRRSPAGHEPGGVAGLAVQNGAERLLEAVAGAAGRRVQPHIEQELAHARAQLEQELASARVQIEQDAAALRTAAEREGYAKGMKRADQAVRQMVDSQSERLDAILAALLQARANAIHDAESAMVEIVYSAVCRIIGEEATAPAAVAGAVRQALAALKSRDNLVIRLHPQDYELLHQVRDVSDLHQAVLRADVSIGIGGCIVECGTGILDATLQTQMERLAQVLLAARRSRDDCGAVL